jgi:hypothetical protein
MYRGRLSSHCTLHVHGSITIPRYGTSITIGSPTHGTAGRRASAGARCAGGATRERTVRRKTVPSTVPVTWWRRDMEEEYCERQGCANAKEAKEEKEAKEAKECLFMHCVVRQSPNSLLRFFSFFRIVLRFVSQSAPLRDRITTIVRHRIRRSSDGLHSSTYVRSNATSSSKERSDRPDTCANPVTPGFTAKTRRW